MKAKTLARLAEVGRTLANGAQGGWADILLRGAAVLTRADLAVL